jgi:hypothetical protein
MSASSPDSKTVELLDGRLAGQRVEVRGGVSFLVIPVPVPGPGGYGQQTYAFTGRHAPDGVELWSVQAATRH